MKNLSISWSEKPDMENFKRQLSGMFLTAIRRIRQGVKAGSICIIASSEFHSLMLDLNLPPAKLGGIFESFGGIPIIVNKNQKGYSAEMKFANRKFRTGKNKLGNKQGGKGERTRKAY